MKKEYSTQKQELMRGRSFVLAVLAGTKNSFKLICSRDLAVICYAPMGVWISFRAD